MTPQYTLLRIMWRLMPSCRFPTRDMARGQKPRDEKAAAFGRTGLSEDTICVLVKIS
jgi:hypothetical protein